MEDTVRLRVEFDDHRHLLTKPQRSEGFRRCWFLLRPGLSTVSDLAAHLVDAFALRRSCPHGVILSMEEFVLPPFESASIFKDKDIVRLRKKVVKKKQPLEICGNAYHIQGSNIVEKQPIHSGDEILAIKVNLEDLEACKIKNGEDACEVEENATNRQTMSTEETNLKRKRKQLDKPQNSEVSKKVAKKKQLQICGDLCHIQDSHIVEEQLILSGDEVLATRVCQEDLEASKSKNREDACEARESAINTETMPSITRKMDKPPNSKRRKIKLTNTKKTIVTADAEEYIHSEQHKSLTIDQMHAPSDGDEKFDKLIISQNKVQKKNCSIMTEERRDQVENCCRSPSDPHLTGNMRKFTSRSARRKKSKKQHYREMAKQQLKENMQDEVPTNDTQPANDVQPSNYLQDTLSKYQAVDQTIEIDEELVPVIVRPGHIRFEPIDGGEHSNIQSNGPVETLQWNGTTSKKKGQKWGMEKTLSRRNEYNTCNGASNENFIAEEGKHVKDHIDFESLFPLTRLPEEGDILVYRLVELSTSWCPELSPFRVGKVSSYDFISMKIILVPVPEYPIFSNENKDAEESAEQPDSTLYKEDGSLEIEYSSLLDVRLFKAHDSDLLQNGKSKEAAQLDDWEPESEETNSEHLATRPSEMRPETGWEEIDQVLSERKAQLQKTDGWATWTPNKCTTTTTSWSYRALRGSALGPTLALLRGNNGKDASSSSKHSSGKYPGSK